MQTEPTPFDRALTDALSRTQTSQPTALLASDWRPKADEYDPSVRAAVDACAAFARDVKADADGKGRWLTLSGVPGCGKTMLAKQTYQHLQFWERMRIAYCSWFDASRFANRLRDGDFSLPETSADAWLVVMDDLGTARDKTDFVADGIYRFCNARLGRWTIFTSNFSIPEIADRIDERVASRLIRDENVFVRLSAGDYALRRMARKS